MNTMSLVSDELWEAIAPLLPGEPPKPKGGRPRNPDRAALGGIIFVLRTGCPLRLLPKELGCGSGTTCWRRLRDWQEAGVWEKLHTRLLNWLAGEAALDWSRASVDSLRACFKTRVLLSRSTARAVPLHHLLGLSGEACLQWCGGGGGRHGSRWPVGHRHLHHRVASASRAMKSATPSISGNDTWPQTDKANDATTNTAARSHAAAAKRNSQTTRGLVVSR